MSDTVWITIESVTASLEAGRRGTEVSVAGRVRLPEGATFEECRVVVAAQDEGGAMLGFDEARVQHESAEGGVATFRGSLRLIAPIAERMHSVSLRCVGVIDERPFSWTVPAEALAAPEAGARRFWRGAGASVVRGGADESGEVRLEVCVRCPLDASSSYERYGELHVSVEDGAGGVQCLNSTSFNTFGGRADHVDVSERFSPRVQQLEGASAFVFTLRTKRHVASEGLCLARAELARDADADD